MPRVLVAGLVALFALSGNPAAAQIGDGSLRGYIKDQQGGVLPGVTVTATSPELLAPVVAVTQPVVAPFQELLPTVRILGGGRFMALRRVVVPLLKRGLAGGFILVFIPATRELSSAIFLYTTGTQVLSVLLFDKSDEGNFEFLASIGLVLVVITVVLVLVGFRLLGRDFLLRRETAA